MTSARTQEPRDMSSNPHNAKHTPAHLDEFECAFISYRWKVALDVGCRHPPTQSEGLCAVHGPEKEPACFYSTVPSGDPAAMSPH